MTKRLTLEEKAERARWRKLRKMSPGERAHALHGSKPRTPEEARDFLALVQRQGEEAAARGAKLLASYEHDDELLQADRGARGSIHLEGYVLGWPRHPLAGPVPMPKGTPLASRVAARTARFHDQLDHSLQGRERYVVRRKWWQFWRPKWVPVEPHYDAPVFRR